MRLVFLCSGLEPGRDGVGDYARLLAAHCAAQGHEVRLASVRDPFCAAATKSGMEFRAPDIFQNPAEARELAVWLHEFRPDWASVQFTPFGFHPRGLGGKRASFLREIQPAATRRHIMLHEIWLQPGRDGPLRHRALGWAQRRSVDAWINTGWKPEVIHTQARLHRVRLQARGANVELLPLCSTIPPQDISPSSARLMVVQHLIKAGSLPQSIDESAIWLGHFGTLHNQEWDFSKFAATVSELAAQVGKRVCFHALGRGQTIARAWAEAARAVPKADFHVHGELPEEKISVMMKACNAAFTSTPWDIVEKSGTVAAWRAMGVPVLVARVGATNAGQLPPWPDPGLILFENGRQKSPLPFERVPGPAFLDPAYSAKTFLTALANAPRP